MSEIRVDKITSPSGTISLSGITTFSTTGSFTIPGGTVEQRPSTPVNGQIRYLAGEVPGSSAIEYYKNDSWIQV